MKVVVRHEAILGISGHIDNLKSRTEKEARERKIRLRGNTLGECSNTMITTPNKFIVLYALFTN